MAESIAPLKEHDLPDREKSFWRMTGPGAVMVGLSIGSGEMVLWPWITARFGADMAWAAVLGIFVQMWVNFEIGRWVISTGESALTGFSRVTTKVIWIFMLMMFVLAWLPGWARATGVSLRHLFFGIEKVGADWMWCVPVYLLIFCLLFGPKRIYSTIEKIIGALVMFIVLSMIVVAFRIGTWSDAAELGGGVLNFGRITTTEDFSFMRFFGAFVFVGAGGFGQVFYSYYLRDKGIGMGKQIPQLTSALRDSGEVTQQTGYIFPDTEENKRRFRDWYLYIKLDNFLYFFLLNVFMTMLFMFGALVVLYRQGIVPSSSTLIWDLSLVLESTMGMFGQYLFLLVAVCAMFSTQLAVADGSYRMWTDMLHTTVSATRKLSESQLYFRLACFFMPIGVFTVWLFDTLAVGVLDFFFISAAINGTAMAIWVPMILYMNLKYLPKSAKPGILNIVMVGIASLIYIAFALFTIWEKVAG